MLPTYKKFKEHLLSVEQSNLTRQPINEDFFKRAEKIQKEQKVRDKTHIEIRKLPEHEFKI